MKKIWIGLIFLLAMSFVISMSSPDVAIGGEDVENINNIVNDYSPLDDSGNVDVEKYRPIVTKAEERIDKINLWLEENATWLKAVFGMVPSISWLFAVNIFVMLLAFSVLVRTGDLLGFSGRKIDLLLFEVSLGKIFGFVIFVTLLALKILVDAATTLNMLVGIFWNYILPWGFVVAVAIAVVAVILLIGMLFYAPKILIGIKKGLDERNEKEKKERENLNLKVLDEVTKGITKDKD